MSDGGSVGNADLVELSLEEEWPRLRAQLELHETTRLTFVFCSSTEQARDLLGRTRAQLRGTGREMAVVAATEREAVVKLVDTLMHAASPAGVLTWVDGVATGVNRREAAISWEQALLRANDHRDALLRRHPDGFVLCLPTELKTAVREAAPDLWAKRVLVMEVDPPLRLVAAPERRSTDVPVGPADDLVVAPPLDAQAAPSGRVLSAELSRARALRAAGNEVGAIGLLEGALASEAPSNERSQALTELAAARAAQDDVAGAIRDLEEALSTGGLTRRQLERSTEQLEALAERDGRPELAVAAARARVALLRDAEPAQLAASLRDLSNRLSDLGRREDALAAISESVALYRALAEARPDAFLPDLALALDNLSNSLSGLGRREDALAAIAEAVALRRALPRPAPKRFSPT